MRNSAREAVERLRNFLEYTSFTGRRERVYFAPTREELCSITLRSISTVIPVYNVPSEHLRM